MRRIFTMRTLVAGAIFTAFALLAPVATADDGGWTERPIEDWYADPRDPIETSLEANGQNAYWVNQWDGSYWLAGGFAPYGCGMTDDLVKSVEGAIEYEGVILERLLPDGRAEVTVEVEVKNSPITVFRSPEMFEWRSRCGTRAQIPIPDPIAGDGHDGSWDYELRIGVIIPEPGAVIKNWLSIANGFVQFPYELTGEFEMHAEGWATFTDAVAGRPSGFQPGDTAHITLDHVVNDRGPDVFSISVTSEADDD
jgi:hypothetical protein